MKDRSMRSVGLRAVLGLLAVASLALTGISPPTPSAHETLVITTLSNRADLVSGGDVLVEVTRADGGAPSRLTATLDGRDVSDRFALRDNGRVQALLTDLEIGDNLLVVDATDGAPAQLTITNHPVGGPIFSGEQIQPWACNTHGLGDPQDAQCNAPTQREWRYESVDGETVTFDPDTPPDPDAVATITTDQDETVPYLWVVETGIMNRGVYRVAMLADPAVALEPWNRPRGWNGGVYYKFGPSCGTHYGSGGAIESVEDHRALSSGYAVATHTLSVLGTNCNTVVSAESLMMVEERIAEVFGPITHTRGKGGSGGSIGQHVVASGYPGLLQGLNVDLAYEDFWTTHKEVADCHLLVNYFTNTSPHLWPDARAQGEVMGHQSVSSCLAWDVTFAPLLDPATGCGAGESYHPTENPDGCRATVQDMQVHELGRRPPEKWTEAEQAAGFGFAESPYDNTGLLYGLRALRAGDITPEQFVDLNEKIGGLDIDGGFQAERSDAEPEVVETLYRSGMVASGETLSRVPIIDIRYFAGNAEIHTNFHSYALAQRLAKAQGHHENQSIWKLFEAPNLPSIAGPESFAMMSEWLHALDGDTQPGTIQERIQRNRPEGAGDSCIFQNQRSQDPTPCAWFGYYGNPLIAAGGPTSNDVLKCAKTPLPIEWPSDGTFGHVPFTPSVGGVAGQWERLRDAFPDGVCDWTRPGIGQVDVEPWTSFADGPGGEALGPSPTSIPVERPGPAG